MIKTLSRGFEGLAAYVAIAGGAGLILATLVTCTSILAKLLGAVWAQVLTSPPPGWMAPILGEEEVVAYAVGMAIFAALPWAMLRMGHVRVELFTPLYSNAVNRALDVLANALMVLIAWALMTRQWFLFVTPARRGRDPMWSLIRDGDWSGAFDRLRLAQESQVLGLPLWPFHIAAEICTILFFIAALVCLGRSLRGVRV